MGGGGAGGARSAGDILAGSEDGMKLERPGL